MSTKRDHQRRQERGYVRIERGNREGAPTQPEHRDQRMAEPVHLTREQMAQQLAEDPEFRELVSAERLADLMAGRLR